MTHRPIHVLITGATAGIGRASALHLARAGMRVFATGRNRAALDALQHEAVGTLLETLELDVTSETSIAQAHAQVRARTNGLGLDVLVNNAGYGQFGPVDAIRDEDVRKQFDTNVFGLLAVTRAFVPDMRARGAGRIIHVGSIGGRLTFPLAGVYNATKYALESLSDAMRVELAPFGLHVSVIEPGVIRTEFAGRTMGLLEGYRDASSPYAPLLARAPELERRFDAFAVGPEHVARAIERAIVARRPRARYVAPRRASMMIWAARVLPTRWVDAIFARAMGITRKALLGGSSRSLGAGAH